MDEGIRQDILSSSGIVDARLFEKEFNGADYINQRNYVWCLVDIARAFEQRQEYDWKNFPYKCRVVIKALAISEGSKRLTQIAMRLTQLNHKSTMAELLAA